jgi:phosphonate transport system substrate-binding protein
MNMLRRTLITLALSLCIPVASHAAPADWPKELKFGLIPTESSDNITERFGNLAQYLEQKLEIPVKLQVASDYAGVITAMQFKHVDLAYFGPKSYVEAADRANAEALVMEVAEDGSKGYKGVIITRKGSDIKSMDDAKGKVWAFTDPNSTSGTLVPTVFFVKTLKIDPEQYFSKVIYSGSHEASILAVKSGKVDIASTNDLDLARGDGKSWQTDKDFQVLWTSELIPGSPMACRSDLPDSLKEALKEAFLSYNDQEGLKMLKLQGYAATDDATYNPIREQIEVKKQLSAK